MKRYLCWLAVLAVVAIPDWALACWPWGAPVYSTPAYFSPPVYSVPVFPPVFVYPPVVGSVVPLPPCEPWPGTTMPRGQAPAAPALTQTPATATAAPATPTGPSNPARQAESTRPRIAPPRVEAVQPAAGKDAAPSAARSAEPSPAPELTLPKPPGKTASDGMPPLVLPNEKSTPKTQRKDVETPKKPALTAIPTPAHSDTQAASPLAPEKKEKAIPTLMPPPGATAVPSAAPASDLLIPPSSLPLVPGSASPERLPSLALPAAVPVNPGLNNTSRSSPLITAATGPITVKQFPVARTGNDPRDGYRTVTFFNHTKQELALTIEGKAVKLPSRSYLEAKLGPSFTWSYGDKPAIKERIPDGAAGLDVLFGG